MGPVGQQQVLVRHDAALTLSGCVCGGAAVSPWVRVAAPAAVAHLSLVGGQA